MAAPRALSSVTVPRLKVNPKHLAATNSSSSASCEINDVDNEEGDDHGSNSDTEHVTSVMSGNALPRAHLRHRRLSMNQLVGPPVFGRSYVSPSIHAHSQATPFGVSRCAPQLGFLTGLTAGGPFEVRDVGTYVLVRAIVRGAGTSEAELAETEDNLSPQAGQGHHSLRANDAQPPRPPCSAHKLAQSAGPARARPEWEDLSGPCSRPRISALSGPLAFSMIGPPKRVRCK